MPTSQNYYNAAAGSLLGAMLMGQTNPADAAMPYLNNISGTISPYYQPYINAGNQALSTLQGQYSTLLGNQPTLQNQYSTLVNNPTAVMNSVGSTYQASPGYNWQVQQANNAINQAAAAGGMAGSPQDQQWAATTTNQLANQDYWNYVNQGMNSYNRGLQGMQGMYNQGLQGEQGLNQMGYNASNELAQSLANAMMSQAMLAYSGQANQNMSQGGGMGFALSSIGDLF